MAYGLRIEPSQVVHKIEYNAGAPCRVYIKGREKPVEGVLSSVKQLVLHPRYVYKLYRWQ